MKTLSLLLSISLIIIYACLFGGASHVSPDALQPFALTLHPSACARFLYPFMHASLLHLFVNVYALLSLAFLSDARLWQFLTAYLIAVTVPSCLLSFTPIVGISGVLYALAGIILMRHEYWQRLLLANLPLLAIQFVLPYMASVLHLYCLIMGLSVGYLFSARYDQQ